VIRSNRLNDRRTSTAHDLDDSHDDRQVLLRLVKFFAGMTVALPLTVAARHFSPGKLALHRSPCRLWLVLHQHYTPANGVAYHAIVGAAGRRLAGGTTNRRY
jgi:hypothetical protein